MLHGNFPFRENDSYENKCKIITKTLLNVKNAGFGGVVLNYVWLRPYVKVPGTKENQDGFYMKGYEYLHGKIGWDLFNFTCEECIRLGMRFWLYDEKGYPSGTAGGKWFPKTQILKHAQWLLWHKSLNLSANLI